MSQNLISIKTKKHKSLGVLTLLFVKLFLLNGPELSLEDAADNIFEDDHTIFKSKVRWSGSSHWFRVGDSTTSQTSWDRLGWSRSARTAKKRTFIGGLARADSHSKAEILANIIMYLKTLQWILHVKVLAHSAQSQHHKSKMTMKTILMTRWLRPKMMK